MKLHQEDPRLTAYILGELAPAEAKAVEHAVAGDPALRLVLAEAEKTQSQLCELLGGGADELLPRQRESIRRAAKEAARKGKVERLHSHRQARKIWLIPLAAAALIASGIFILTKIPAPKAGGGKPVSANGKGVEMPPVNPGVEIVRQSGDAVQLPLQVGRQSLSRVSNAVRVAGRKPTVDEVDIPEMLNAFPLKANASVALLKGCKLGTEILPCPWKPSASLILVEVHGARDGARELSVEYRADDESVISHRIIGYPSEAGEAGAARASRMDSNSTMLLVIELASKTPELGELIWSVDGVAAPEIPLVHDPEREPSDDARFAALVCGFGMWLRGEDPVSVDDSVILGLAREVAADELVADRYDFLNLIDQAMKLNEE